MLQEVPGKAELRLCSRLRLGETQTAELVAAMRAGKSNRAALVLTPNAPAGYAPPFPCESTLSMPWLPPRVFVPAEGVQPSAYDDYRERGYYYLLDLSSCWESAALAQVPVPVASLDLCAAPGGKTMLMAARFPQSVHTANEVNASRRGILRQNLQKSGLAAEVTGLRPDQWTGQGRLFDLLLVDAPCSGQSLLCKGIRNPGCLGARMVNGNAKRQKGILLATCPVVAPGGYLLYSTCTYDPDENEKVISYVLRRVPGWQAVEVPTLAPFLSPLADFPAYRLLPAHGFGAGGFCALLRKTPQELP